MSPPSGSTSRRRSPRSTGLVGLGIALSCEVALVDADQLTLSALGLRPRERAIAASAIALPVAIGGAALAFVGAFFASSLFPIGVARDAEPSPGLRMDVLPLVVGALVVLVTVVVVTGVAATRMTRLATRSLEPRRPGAAARATSGIGAPPTVTAGTHFALDRGRYRRALPVRSSLVGATFGIMVVVAVLVFSSSLDELASTPSAYGWTWDMTEGDTSASAKGDDCSPVTTRLTRAPELAAVGVDLQHRHRDRGSSARSVGLPAVRAGRSCRRRSKGAHR